MAADETMDVGNPLAVERSAHVSSRRPAEDDVQLGNTSAHEPERMDEHVGAFDQLRLEPFSPADAVLLERADGERGLWDAELRARGRTLPGGPQRERVQVDTDSNG